MGQITMTQGLLRSECCNSSYQGGGPLGIRRPMRCLKCNKFCKVIFVANEEQ